MLEQAFILWCSLFRKSQVFLKQQLLILLAQRLYVNPISSMALFYKLLFAQYSSKKYN